MAQLSKSSEKEGVVFAPQKGQWQVSMVFGHNGFYNQNSTFLLPRYDNLGNGSVGLPNGGTTTSGNLDCYLNINGFDNNSVVNIAGLQVKYFVSDCWDINLSQDYINAQTKNNWYVTVGTDRYFKTKNPRIHPYVGAALGFQMARIETMEPYTGETVYDEDLGEEELQQVYLAGGKAGQIFGLKAAGVSCDVKG